MKRGTTSALKFNIDVDMSLVDSIVFAFNTSWQETDNPTLVKSYPADGELIDGYIYLYLTQTETKLFVDRMYIESQVNFTDKSVAKSDIVQKVIKDTLFTTVIDGSVANSDTAEAILMEISDEIIVNSDGSGTTVDAYSKAESDSRYAKKTDIPTTLPASDVYAWAKESAKPTYTADEVGALPNTTIIPSKTSDLTNDSNFKTGTEIETIVKDTCYTKTEVDELIPNVKDGTDGVSPTVSVSKVDKVATLTITDATGEKEVKINDGTDGADGKDLIHQGETVSDSGVVARQLTANVLCMFSGTVSDLTITLPSTYNFYDEFNFTFITDASGCNLSIPSDCEWITEPTLDSSTRYEVSIVNNVAVISSGLAVV